MSNQLQKLNNEIDNTLLYKGLCKNITVYIAMFMLTIVALYGLKIIAPDKDDNDSLRIPYNRVDVFTPDSQLGGELITKGSIPISALEIFDENKNYSEKIRILNNAIDESNKLPINHGMNLKTDKYGELFELELYVPRESQYLDILEEYKAIKGIKSDNEVILDGIYGGGNRGATVSSNEIMISSSSFNKTVQELKQKYNGNTPVECTYAMFLLSDDTSFKEFASSQQIKKLYGGNYFIVSKTILDTYAELMAIKTFRSALIFLTILTTIIVVVDELSLTITLRRNKKIISIYRDIGVDKDNIYKTMKKKYLNKWPYLSAVFIVAICAILLSIFKFKEVSITSFMSLYILITALIIDLYWKRYCIASFLKNIYKWDVA